MNNYEKIISKTPKEIAVWLNDIVTYCGECPAFESCNGEQLDCVKATEEWLNSEVTE